MAHEPSDVSVRLLQVAIGGVIALVGLVVGAAAFMVYLGSKEPGTSQGIGAVALAVGVVGAATFLVAGSIALARIVSWRRHRRDRSNRP